MLTYVVKFFEFFTQNKETKIGSIECEERNAVSTFLSMCSSMGMFLSASNSPVTNTSSKTIKIQKKAIN